MSYDFKNDIELFQFTQARYPGSDKKIDLNNVIKVDNFYLGENTFIF